MRADLLGAATSLVLWLGTAAPAHAESLYVSGRASLGAAGARSCARPDHVRVQDAVDAAAAGDTIIVCPGLYAEQVTVLEKSLVLEARPGAIIHAPGDAVGAVVRLAGPQVSRITGFVVSGAGAAGIVEGIRVDGFDFDTEPPPMWWTDATITHNYVRDIEGRTSGRVAGTAIRAEEARRVSIRANHVERYGEVGIEVDGNQVACESFTIADNVVHGRAVDGPEREQIGILIDECEGIIERNQLTGQRASSGEGIGVVVEFARATVQLNLIAHNQVGVRLVPGAGAVVHANRVEQSEGTALALLGTRAARVTGNLILYSGAAGIALDRALDTDVAKNLVIGAGTVGIDLSLGATGNRLRHNHLRDSDGPDLRDANGGPPANLFESNSCEESIPAGLCIPVPF